MPKLKTDTLLEEMQHRWRSGNGHTANNLIPFFRRHRTHPANPKAADISKTTHSISHNDFAPILQSLSGTEMVNTLPTLLDWLSITGAII